MHTTNADQGPLAFLREHRELLTSALHLYQERMHANAEQVRAEGRLTRPLKQVAADFKTQGDSAAMVAYELQAILDAALWAEARAAGSKPYLTWDEHGYLVAIDHPDHGELEGEHRYKTEEGAAAVLLKIQREAADG